MRCEATVVDEQPGVLTLERAEFELFRELILEDCGINVAPTKRLLVQNRVGKRLRLLGFNSFYRYYRYLQSSEGREKERKKLWSAITTNETHFFREAHHFDVLRRQVIKAIVSRPGPRRRIRIWSAGCSTGQEPYTLAMVLDDCLRHHPGWRYEVVGTDIDQNVLATARTGHYPTILRREVPARFLMRYFDADRETLCVGKTLRKSVSFRWLNLAEAEAMKPRFDVIFCRNVIMYLHMDTRHRLAQVFRDSLVPDGCLFLGSSESFHGIPRFLDVERSGKTAMYRRKDRSGNGGG